jgi:hypothetical protein
MKKKIAKGCLIDLILGVFLFFVVIIAQMENPIGVFANQESPPEQPDINLSSFNISGERTTELFETARTIQPGDCSGLISPYFVGVKRDLTLNEDTTIIQVLYDEKLGAVCAIIIGSWPGTVTNDGIQEFDSMMRAYEGYELLEVQDEPLIRSNPFLSGIPFHLYSWELPKGGGEYYFIFDFFQQQILGDLRLGMSHRDWSGVFKSEMYKIYLPLIFNPEEIIPTPTPTPSPSPTPTQPPPPTPTPTPVVCPNWSINAYAPGFTISALTYKIGGNHYPNIGYLYFGETMLIRIKDPMGIVSDLPSGGETTVYNSAGNVVAEYGRDGSFSIVGGQGPYGEDFFTFDSSFPFNGVSCRASFKIWDPEQVLDALQERYEISRQEALQLLDQYLIEADEATLSQMEVWDWVKTH